MAQPGNRAAGAKQVQAIIAKGGVGTRSPLPALKEIAHVSATLTQVTRTCRMGAGLEITTFIPASIQFLHRQARNMAAPFAALQHTPQVSFSSFIHATNIIEHYVPHTILRTQQRPKQKKTPCLCGAHILVESPQNMAWHRLSAQ